MRILDSFLRKLAEQSYSCADAWNHIAGIAAILVTFVTVYGRILPAICVSGNIGNGTLLSGEVSGQKSHGVPKLISAVDIDMLQEKSSDLNNETFERADLHQTARTGRGTSCFCFCG